ncbi:MAG: SMP-30/gluconolactonase/LRE family protein [Nevskia sp.]|nr:SMP-30/gluconolactonase/LRE family protein [Nevskia sp.]
MSGGIARRLYHRWSLRLFLSELLAKRWMEPAIPFVLMLALIAYFGAVTPNYATWGNARQLGREFAEMGFVVIAMALVVISGGIDLSVGSVFAFANLTALGLFQIGQLPVLPVIAGTLAAGAAVGAVNGVLVGYFKTRPFLTTLVTLIILRAVVDLLSQHYSVQLAMGSNTSALWDFLGGGALLGIPSNLLVLGIVGGVGHVLLSRSRPGWHLTAIGSSRKAARHAGIAVESTLCLTYVASGMLAAAGGLFYAARLSSTGSDTGVGWEVNALTAAVLGGVSLSGGRGTVARAVIGAVIVFVLVNGLVRMGFPGALTSTALGAVLLFAVGVDVKWAKNRVKAIQKIYLNPTVVELPPAPSTARDSGTPFAENDRLRDSEEIGLDQVEGPEDVILDRQDRLYCGTRDGLILRFSGPRFEQREVFARIGGRPLGMAFDRDENLLVCVGGMGLYGVTPQGKVYKATDETNRSWFKLNDDSRLRLADDLDIAPDGKIYFSEATIRYEMHSWHLDGMEGRANGRLICYDPATRRTRTVIKDIVFPNGVCVAHDGQSLLFASTWLCSIFRYWIDGPKKGKIETLIDNLPGYTDNINRASDGCYWLALVGIRSPAFDLAMRNPGFRLRMVKQIPPDEWILPGINNGCVLKFNEKGEVLESLWDPGGRKHATLTSMREHKGWLYLGGLENNRIGRIRLPDADPDWNGFDDYWRKGKA